MLHTFSPNWFRPQCLLVTQNFLYYSSNYLLYEYSLQSRTVTKQLCLRQQAITQKINFKDIKILAIVSHSIQDVDDSFLYVSINQPYIFHTRVHQKGFTVQKVIKVSQTDCLVADYLYAANTQNLIIGCSQMILKYCYSDNQITKIKAGSHQQKNRIKGISLVDKYNLVVYLKGQIELWDFDMTVILKSLRLQYNESILSCDFLVDENWVVGLLTRIKDNNFLTVFRFTYQDEFPVEKKKKIDEIAEGIIKVGINLQYPKKFMDRTKDLHKAALSIKILPKSEIIMTGKLGQVYTIFLNKLNHKQQLELRPFSNVQSSQYFIWPDSKHYKEIYQISLYNNHLYFLSTDHNLSVWSCKQKSITHNYSIKFLTTGVSSIFYSESDPRTIFVLLRDSIIRSFSPLEEGAHYLNQYWKFTKKFNVIKVTSHLNDEGIMAMLTDQLKIIIYDIYEDRLMKVIDMPQQVISISFELQKIIDSLSKIYNCQPTLTDSYKTLNLFSKQLKKDVVLMVQMKNVVSILYEPGSKEHQTYELAKDKKLERIDKCKYWNQQTLISSTYKNNLLTLVIVHKDKIYNFNQVIQISSARIIYKSPLNTQKLYLIIYKGVKLIIQQMQFRQQLEVLTVKEVNTFIPVDQIVTDYQSNNICLYNQRDNLLQIMDITNVNSLQLYNYSTKIECLSFYLKDYLVVGSKDQALKVIRWSQLSLNMDEKKIKKKLNNQMKQISLANEKSEKMMDQKIIEVQIQQQPKILFKENNQ